MLSGQPDRMSPEQASLYKVDPWRSPESVVRGSYAAYGWTTVQQSIRPCRWACGLGGRIDLFRGFQAIVVRATV